ncbi:MAG: hypothetical protein C0391_08415 [Anaerolinea sp.]|nr:hypothetical protein [Anaerolinea sp.]
MRVLIGVENNNERRSVAWALEHFGCYALAPDGQSAVVAMAKAIPEYIQWLESHTNSPWFNPAEIDIRLVEVVDDHFIDPHYEQVVEGGKLIKAWFKTDWKPLSQLDVEHILQIISWSRQELVELVANLDDKTLDATLIAGEWTICQIIAHVGRSEWWLMDRLGRTHPEDQLPEDPFERLLEERGNLVEILPDLIDLQQVVGKEGEIWSPRKVARRFCWHERDHIQQIKRLLAATV